LLRKALYRLRRSPLLWQQKLTDVFTNLGFKPVPQEPCVAISGGTVVFYYVDDIVFAYKKQDKPLVDRAIKGLKKQFEITDCGELKWFLGIHVLRDRQRRCLWLSQSSYIEKIADKCKIDLSSKPPNTPMHEAELLPSLKQATRQSSL
jgi:hypothetical protein